MTGFSFHNPLDLSALADRSGEVRWDRLAPLTADSDVVVGELVDEELLLCRRFAGLEAEADPHWTPHLWGLEPALRPVATRTVERLDLAHGVIEYPPEAPDDVDLSPLLDALVMAFQHSVRQLTWHCDLRERGTWDGAVLVLDDGTVLHDDIERESGQHVVVFRSREREALQIAGALDPDDRAGEGPAVALGVGSEGGPDLHQLAATALTSATLERGEAWSSGPPRLRVRSFSTRDGLWVLDEGDARGQTGPRRLDDAGVTDLARQLLE